MASITELYDFLEQQKKNKEQWGKEAEKPQEKPKKEPKKPSPKGDDK